MTPYTKQIVELHKIHKAIENCGCNKDDEQGGGDNENITLITNDEYFQQDDAKIYTREAFTNFDDNEDLTLDIYMIGQEDIENINNSIYNNKKSKVGIGLRGKDIIFIDKFEVLNEYEENDEDFQTIKIHIHKTAVILPIINNNPIY